MELYIIVLASFMTGATVFICMTLDAIETLLGHITDALEKEPKQK